MTDLLAVPRAPFDMEDPWAIPAVCTPVPLRCATDGSMPRLGTSIAAWYDATALSVLFSGADDHIESSLMQHDDPLYEQDVVELFLAPERLTRYFELEVSPRGTLFDALIDSPDGVRRTMTADRGWTCAGLLGLVRTLTDGDGSMTLDILVRVPFAALERRAPEPGETWRANFYRIDRHPRHGSEFTAWQPTLVTPADFHVAAKFGTLRFE